VPTLLHASRRCIVILIALLGVVPSLGHAAEPFSPARVAVYFSPNWLRVLYTAEPPQIDERVGHQLHAVVPTLMVLEAQQQALKFVLPRKGPFDALP
jgi:hypothetical protein